MRLSHSAFNQRLAESDVFRRFVFGSFGTRLASLMLLFEEVTFERVDVRLASYLVQAGDGELNATHQMIATELGSAREVISRHLKEFERRGWLEMQRGRIRVRNRHLLEQLARRL
ncbi:Cyclic nucleotide-binding:Bacterial regulatory protein, Crp (fragment) [Cupriavidus necator]|uniref:Cyclic nucleotide-binding:Bacterial regulatory protein, Crp n=1 Tax=Cupriavidus necator TaxID=106590 RepID=A0A1K0JCC9_CUPNE